MPSNTTALRQRSCTTDPYLLNTARLHRVDASQLPHGAGVSLGHCRTDLPAQRVIPMKAVHACEPLRCMGDPACPDHHCEGHPRSHERDDKRCTCTPETKCAQHQHQGALFTKGMLAYGVVLFLAALATWQWLSR